MSEILPSFQVPQIEVAAIAPVLIVIVTGIIALIFEMARPKNNNVGTNIASILGLGVAGFFAWQQLGLTPSESLGNMVVVDRFGAVMQILLVLACGITILFSEGYMREKKIAFGEFYPLVLWSTAGAMMMVTTKNLLMVFIGLEILSIALYVLAGLSRNEAKSEESAIKYFLLGAFATGFLLYGIALIYGATGSLHFDDIGRVWDGRVPQISGLMLMGLALALVGFCFKAGFVPFHQWTPDVYQGAPTNVTAFMAAASKIAAVATLFRFLDACAPMQEYWGPVLFWIALLSMTVGNLVALAQKDIKRILAYSSIAHAGYILVAILAHAKVPSQVGWGTLAIYLLSYSLMTIGAFIVISLGAKGGKEGTRLQHLNGLWQRSPWAAIALVVFMASLIGIPPTAGFLAKLQIFQDAVSANLWPLAIGLAVNSAISVYYYLGIAMAAFVNEQTDNDVPTMRFSPSVGMATGICVAGVFLVTVFFAPISNALFGPDGTVVKGQIVQTEPGERVGIR